MSSPWAPIYIPLAKGLDLSKEAQLGGDELHTALNVDFGPDGSIKGRPARAADDLFYVRNPAYLTDTTPTYIAGAAYSQTGRSSSLSSVSLLSVRDGSGERAALADQGRLFLHEGSKWHDRGHFACTRVDRMPSLPMTGAVTDPSTGRRTMAPDFGSMEGLLGLWALYNGSSGALEEHIKGTVAPDYSGTGTRSGTTTAAVTVFTGNFLHFTYRVNGAGALTSVQLANDAALPADDGDAPCICPIEGGGFYVAYYTTVANQFKVLKISITGTIAWTYTKATAEAGLQGIWVASHSTGTAIVAFTHNAGLTIRQLDAAGAAAGDSTDATAAGSECVVGYDLASSGSDRAFWAYKTTAREHVVLGWTNTATNVAAVLKTLRGTDSLGNNEPGLRWSICHQPVSWANGRCYITLACASARAYTATWLTLDLANVFTALAVPAGPFSSPTIVARGAANATYPHRQPCPAVMLSDNSGFMFPTQDWQRFGVNSIGSLTGAQALIAYNRVLLSKPRAAQLGETTVFSGSVPHMVARGDSVELGWPFLSGEPGLYANAPVAAGALTNGASYTVQACWTWTDEAGQIHRSAPSVARTVVLAAPNLTIRCYVVPPWLTEKVSRVRLEVYCTPANPTSTALKYLVSTTTWSGSTASEPYVTVDIANDPATTADVLYTDGTAGQELANYHVPGDGGVTTTGRRLWLASGTQVFASKTHTDGYGPSFNDEAIADQPSLYINLPAGAGRVIALEALDDKVVVFCARGVYLVQDGGPDNTGAGADFSPALRISDLRIAGPRSACSTDAGVLFCSELDTVDAARGGPWLVDRQFTFTERQFLGRQAADFHLRTGSWVPEVTYSPERQQAYVTTNKADGGSLEGVVVIDFRLSKWATWSIPSGGVPPDPAYFGTLRSVACVSGILWVLNDDPAPYSATPGTDDTSGDYAMVIKTAALSANGQDGVGWARVRSVSPHSADGTASHTLTITAYLDQVRTALSSGAITQTTGAEATWPSSRLDPEWRLPIQKCSTLAVQLSATPAVARWAAIRLDVAPLPRRAPAKTRI